MKRKPFTFWNSSQGRLFKILTTLYNIIGNLQTCSQKLFAKCFSSTLNYWPSASEESTQYAPKSMSSLHASPLADRHTTTILIHIIILVGRATRITTKWFTHCNR